MIAQQVQQVNKKLNIRIAITQQADKEIRYSDCD